MSTSVVRAARILDRLAHSQTPMTLAEIASELDIPKSTAYTTAIKRAWPAGSFRLP
jgi:DNA-binding IclR family transcriptional regulator